MKRALNLLVATCLLLPAVCMADQAKEPVKIGVIGPLTGGLAKRGEDLGKLIELLEPELNSRSSKYSFSFVVGDGRCGAGNSATTLAHKFIHIDKIKFLITNCSGETLQAAPIAQREGVVTFAVLSTHQDIKNLGDYIFRTFVDIERGVENFAKHMKKKSGKVAILTEENAFTFGIKELLMRHLGESVVFADDFPPDTADFNTLLTKIGAKGAAGVYFNVLSESTLAVLTNQSRSLGLSYDIYSYNMPEATSFIELTGQNSEGLEFIGSPRIIDASESFQMLLKTYLAKHPAGPSYEFLLRTFYDAVDLIVRGVEQEGLNPELVRDFVSSYKGQGALGDIFFDANGDVGNINYVLKRIQDGEVRYVGELVGPDAIR